LQNSYNIIRHQDPKMTFTYKIVLSIISVFNFCTTIVIYHISQEIRKGFLVSMRDSNL